MLLGDCNEEVCGYRNPYLGFHGVETGAIEGFNSQVLFDPFEEEFDLPTGLVELCDNQRWQ